MGDVELVDLNNDLLPDFLLTGSDTTVIYQNFGGDSLSTIPFTFPNLRLSYWSVGDYDCDQYLDLLLCGWNNSDSIPQTILYRNLGDFQFEKVTVDLPGVSVGFAEWVDINKDGGLDIIISGASADSLPLTQTYLNDRQGGFQASPTNLMPLKNSAISTEDLDQDGYPELLLMGSDSTGRHTKLYHNQQGEFVDLNAEFQGLEFGGAAWADFNQNGKLDLALTGKKAEIEVTIQPSGFPYFRTSPTVFLEVYELAGLDSIYRVKEFKGGGAYSYSSVDWADYDNDGDDDLLVTGMTGFGRLAVGIGGANATSIAKASSPRIYNYAPESGFQSIEANIPAFHSGNTRTHSIPRTFVCSTLKFADYNGDHSIDLIREGASEGFTAAIYKNFPYRGNQAPTPPQGLQASIHCDSVILSWEASSDDHSPATGITYELYVGTEPGIGNLYSQKNERRIRSRQFPIGKLSPGTYYWGVKARDNARAFSAYSTEASFTIPDIQPLNIQLKGDTLLANQSQWVQWYKDGSPVEGANTDTLIVETGGAYFAVLTPPNCEVDTSSTITITLTQTETEQLAEYYHIFPNPVDDVLHVYSLTSSSGDFQLINAAGTCLQRGELRGHTQINTKALPKGIFFLLLSSENRFFSEKIVK
jgi:hypothetical protein